MLRTDLQLSPLPLPLPLLLPLSLPLSLPWPRPLSPPRLLPLPALARDQPDSDCED